MEVLMIGTGSAFSRKYGNTSALVRLDSGYNLLIDCGFTTPTDLDKRGVKLTDIDGILITHLHADHVGGLEEVAFKNRYIHGHRKIDLLVSDDLDRDLWLHSLKGGLEHTEEGICTIHDYFNVHLLDEIGSDPSIAGEEIFIHRTQHVPYKHSFAVSIGNMLYTSDTKFDPEWLDDLSGHEVIFHDCQLFRGGIHASLQELLTLPKYIQRKIYLMHYGDNVEDFRGHTGDMEIAIPGFNYIF